MYADLLETWQTIMYDEVNVNWMLPELKQSNRDLSTKLTLVIQKLKELTIFESDTKKIIKSLEEKSQEKLLNENKKLKESQHKVGQKLVELRKKHDEATKRLRELEQSEQHSKEALREQKLILHKIEQDKKFLTKKQVRMEEEMEKNNVKIRMFEAGTYQTMLQPGMLLIPLCSLL